MNFSTERLFIRPVIEEDSKAMFQYRSDAETNKFLSLVPKSVDDVADFINNSSPSINIPGTWFQFALIEQQSNKLIGDVGVHFLLSDPQNRQAEIGFTLDKHFRSKGYAAEALTTIIDFLVNDLHKHRIIASIDPANNASLRLVERLGFRKEAHFVKSLYFHGEWVDDVIYAILADEWNNKKIK